MTRSVGPSLISSRSRGTGWAIRKVRRSRSGVSGRSFFRIELSALSGWTIDDTSVTLTLLRSYSNLLTPVDLYHITAFEWPDSPMWEENDVPGFWSQNLATAVGRSWGTAPPALLEFRGATLRDAVRAQFASGAQYMTFGLRNQAETDRAHGKKYEGFSLRLNAFVH